MNFSLEKLTPFFGRFEHDFCLNRSKVDRTDLKFGYFLFVGLVSLLRHLVQGQGNDDGLQECSDGLQKGLNHENPLWAIYSCIGFFAVSLISLIIFHFVFKTFPVRFIKMRRKKDILGNGKIHESW